MSKIRDLVGNKYGRLLVERFMGTGTGGALWECSCDCGNTSVVRRGDLLSGKTRSCGCLALETRRIEHGLSAFNKVLNSYKQHARRRGYSWGLSKEEFKSLTQQPCKYCGQPPSNYCGEKAQCKNGGYTYTGIDRVDNTKGYFLSNVVPCCGVCNRAKDTQTEEDFLSWVSKVYIKTLLLQQDDLK